MKKTFKMTHPKIKVPRLVEAIKYEVKKYIKRERRKPLPDTVDYWDFDCRYGADEASSEVIHLSAINKSISQAEAEQLESFYLEFWSNLAFEARGPGKSNKPTGKILQLRSKRAKSKPPLIDRLRHGYRYQVG